jgi:hypothetical protein
MIPMNKFYDIIKNHCEYKLDIYRKMFNNLIRKQEKHVSFDGISNINNNNSTTINSSSSSNSSTPQQQYVKNSNENFRNKKNLFNKYRQTEIRDKKRKFLLITYRIYWTIRVIYLTCHVFDKKRHSKVKPINFRFRFANKHR